MMKQIDRDAEVERTIRRAYEEQLSPGVPLCMGRPEDHWTDARLTFHAWRTAIRECLDRNEGASRTPSPWRFSVTAKSPLVYMGLAVETGEQRVVVDISGMSPVRQMGFLSAHPDAISVDAFTPVKG